MIPEDKTRESELSLSCSHVLSDQNAWSRVTHTGEDGAVILPEKVLTSSRPITVEKETQKGAVPVTLYHLVTPLKKQIGKGKSILAIGLEYCCLWLYLHNIVISACSHYKTKMSGVFSLICSHEFEVFKIGYDSPPQFWPITFQMRSSYRNERHPTPHPVRRGPLGRWGAFSKRAGPSDVSEEWPNRTLGQSQAA